ncbi:MAG: InlB B-repeat-containing protein [Chitinispirillaceae bacterium]|nr:InlB B-repeat-containing protein [Chitinispirillaceae bacterium]
MKAAIQFLPLILVVMIVSCMMNSGGTGSEVGDRPLISGTVVDTRGNPAVDATVTVRPSDYLPDIKLLSKRITENGFYVWSTRTDHNGYFSFHKKDSIPEGRYIIEARDDSNNCAFIGNMEIDSSLYFDNTDSSLIHDFNVTLKPPGAIRGTLQPVTESVEVFVKVFGLDAYAKADADGGFLLENLPQGKHILQFITVRSDTSYDTVKVTTTPGTTADIDTLVPAAYRVVYDGNGNTAGTGPEDGNWYETGEKLVVTGNAGNLTRAGFIFTGWNTREDGSGTSYAAGDTLEKGENKVTLYAQWAEKQYVLTVTADGNGTVSGSDSMARGVPHAITATPDTGNRFSVWRVTSGNAVIADSFKATTTVTLEDGDATVEGVFIRVITFQKAVGGSGDDYGLSVQQTTDGGFVITGSTSSSVGDSSYVYLIKTDAEGNAVWTKTFGGGRGKSVQQTSDGGFVIAGETSPRGALSDVYLIKTDAEGNAAWTKAFGVGVEPSVQQTNDGGLVVIFSGGGAVYLIKTDVIGNVMWTKTFWGTDSSYSAMRSTPQQTTDGGMVLLMEKSQAFDLIKMDANGDTVWTKTFGGANSSFNCYGHSVQQTTDEGFIITAEGLIITADTATGTFLIKTDADGNVVWTKSVGKCDWGHSAVQQTTDGGFVLTACAWSKYGLIYSYLVKTDANGNTELTKTFEQGFGTSLQRTTDGGFVLIGEGELSGSGDYDILLIKTDENGTMETVQ